MFDILQRARRLAVAATPGVREGGERGAQCELVRELVACPAARVRIREEWLRWEGGMVLDLAWGIEEEQAFGRMPILGDALEEAGCDNQALLDHCRAGGGHLRGCWALDAVLGRG